MFNATEENSIAIFEAYIDRFEFAKQHYHNCKDTILKKLTELGVSLYNKNLIKPHNVIQAYEDSIVSNLKIYKKDILSSSAISFKFKAMMVGIIHFGKIYDLLYKKILGGKK